ncbi:hypothetical protein [Nocardia rhizosphaerihabitans]|uniref:Uncharacterized protein n=1 Tax=Nocardia rhizosphaerihabitans TaxID=1691570 RepID=A0ABQ2KGB4_9NOCA|nr:hypothetical protein [Nocardia rhizosphaerihabitans]GGN78597.1 hypothetical protein GCM10011610_26310 [Nocardia rhizosphaerihabitans]
MTGTIEPTAPSTGAAYGHGEWIPFHSVGGVSFAELPTWESLRYFELP